MVGVPVGTGVTGHTHKLSSGNNLYVIGTQQGQSTISSSPSWPDYWSARVNRTATEAAGHGRIRNRLTILEACVSFVKGRSYVCVYDCDGGTVRHTTVIYQVEVKRCRMEQKINLASQRVRNSRFHQYSFVMGKMLPEFLRRSL